MHEAGVEEVLRRITMAAVLGPVKALVALEEEQGRRVVRPGEAAWLPLRLWNPDTVCSVGDGAANLILLSARRPGHGALGLLLTAVREAGLVPLVHSPSPRLERHLEAAGWIPDRRGEGFTAEHFMRPPPPT